MEKEKSQRIKLIIALSVLYIVAVIFIFRFMIYQKIGERELPYSVSKIIVVSTATKSEGENPSTSVDGDGPSKEQNEETQTEEQTAEQAAEEPAEQPAEETSEAQNEEGQSEEESSEEQSANQPAEDNSIWKFYTIQTNDVYISIKKNDENIKKNEKIKSVSIENIHVDENPKRGEIRAFMPNSMDGQRYEYKKEYVIKNSLTYRGSDKNDYKDLLIQENGGIIGFSLANVDLGEYSSGDDTEIAYNGKLLNKLGITDEDVKFKVSFDIIIELDDGKKYSGRVTLDVKCENLVLDGKSQLEVTDFHDVIFKRL